MSQEQDIVEQLNQLKESRLNLDLDLDGLTVREEERLGTNPYSFDTDGDGKSDYLEIGVGSAPLDNSEKNYQYQPPEVEPGSPQFLMREKYLEKAIALLGQDFSYEDLYQEGNNQYLYEVIDLEVIQNSLPSERIPLLSQSPYIQFQINENQADLQSIFQNHVQFLEQVCVATEKLEKERQKQFQVKNQSKIVQKSLEIESEELFLGQDF